MIIKMTTYGIGGYDPTKPNNNVVEETDIDVPQQPLDAAGALATLLVVLGIVPLEDAANSVHLAPEQLIAEAQAWSVG